MELPPELEDAIAAAPNDREGYAVAGDWLAQKADPQGELIAFQLAGDNEAIANRVLALQRQLAPVPVGERAATRLEWRWGFVRGAVFSGRDLEELHALLVSPVCRFLQKLVLAEANTLAVATVYEARRSDPRALRCLRMLQIVGAMGAPLTVGLDMVSTLESIERLGLRAPFTRGALALPRLRELALAEVEEPPTPIVATGDLPVLERLQLAAREQIAPLDHWLRPERVPALRRLTLSSPIMQLWPRDRLVSQLDHFSFFGTPPGVPSQRTVVIDRSVPSDAALLVMIGRGDHRPGELIPIHLQLSIGRAADNDLVLADPDVAGQHAIIAPLARNMRWQLQARGEELTYVEGLQIPTSPLFDGDDIGIGRHVFRFIEGDVESKAAALRKRYGF